MSSPAVTLAPGTSPDRKPYLWVGLTSFFLMWSFLYICLVVFRPTWVCVAARDGEVVVVDNRAVAAPNVDQARAFVVALIITLIVMLIVWLVMATASAGK